jgi:hypothetical protein
MIDLLILDNHMQFVYENLWDFELELTVTY